MKKIIQIDIGTHYGQELLSLFIPFYVFCKFLKLIINNSLRNKRSIPNSNFNAIKYLLPTLKSSYKIHRKRDNFILVGIEPNTLLFNSRVYTLLDIVLPIAIGNSDYENLSLEKLFFGYSNPRFKGNSIFASKKNLNVNNFRRIICTNPYYIFQKLDDLDELKNHKIIIRLNCEGSEDEIIYSAFNIFGNRLIGLMGNLSDVTKTKNKLLGQELKKFIDTKKIPFTLFDSNPTTWYKAHKFILNTRKKYNVN